MSFLRGGPNTADCPRDKNSWCWDSHYGQYQCDTPAPIYKPCALEIHETPAFENNTVWQCDKCGRLYIFEVRENRYASKGFTAEWRVKSFQKIMWWEKK